MWKMTSGQGKPRVIQVHDVLAELTLAESGTACASLAWTLDTLDQAQQQLTQQGHTSPGTNQGKMRGGQLGGAK